MEIIMLIFYLEIIVTRMRTHFSISIASKFESQINIICFFVRNLELIKRGNRPHLNEYHVKVHSLIPLFYLTSSLLCFLCRCILYVTLCLIKYPMGKQLYFFILLKQAIHPIYISNYIMCYTDYGDNNEWALQGLFAREEWGSI